MRSGADGQPGKTGRKNGTQKVSPVMRRKEGSEFIAGPEPLSGWGKGTSGGGKRIVREPHSVRGGNGQQRAFFRNSLNLSYHFWARASSLASTRMRTLFSVPE